MEIVEGKSGERFLLTAKPIDWSFSTLDALAPPLLTCEAVIAEASWQWARSRESVSQLYRWVAAGALPVVDLLPRHMPHLQALSAKYLQMDLLGAAVVRPAEMFPSATVIPTDCARFTVYRRSRSLAVNEFTDGGVVHPRTARQKEIACWCRPTQFESPSHHWPQ